MKAGWILGFGAGLAMGAAASASTIFYDGEIFSDGGIPQFAASLGTLQSAAVTLVGDGASGGGILCPDDQYSAFYDVTLTVDLLGETLGSGNSFGFECTEEGEIFEWVVPVSFTAPRFFDGADLAPFIGTGLLSVPGTVGTGLSYGYVFYDVTYSFTQVAPVPLPASGGLLIAALGGAAALRRRRANA